MLHLDLFFPLPSCLRQIEMRSVLYLITITLCTFFFFISGSHPNCFILGMILCFNCSLCLIFPAFALFSRSFLLSCAFLSLLSFTLSLSRPYAMRNDWKHMCPCLPIHLISVIYSQALQNNPLRLCCVLHLSILVNTFRPCLVGLCRHRKTR